MDFSETLSLLDRSPGRRLGFFISCSTVWFISLFFSFSVPLVPEEEKFLETVADLSALFTNEIVDLTTVCLSLFLFPGRKLVVSAPIPNAAGLLVTKEDAELWVKKKQKPSQNQNKRSSCLVVINLIKITLIKRRDIWLNFFERNFLSTL